MNSMNVNFEKNRIILNQLQNSLKRDRNFKFTSFEKIKFVETKLIFELLKTVLTKTFERELAFKKELLTIVQMFSTKFF